MTTAPIAIDGNTCTVTFDRYDLDAYALFIRTKKLPESQVLYDHETDIYRVTTPARFAPLLGLTAVATDQPFDELAPHLFDYQRWAVRMALEARRFALWFDTGLGKCPMALEWSRQVLHATGGRVLYLTYKDIVPEVVKEAARWYGGDLPIERIDSREDLATWCQGPGARLGITNYQKLIPRTGEPEILSELRYLAGIAADESSILKTGGGTIKWALIKSARGIPYKLSLTATPAPNDAMEYASQASFLETLRHEGQILWTYFTRNKAGEWEVKPHAREDYYRFLASWSLYMRDPKAFGFGDILATLPKPNIQEIPVAITDEQRRLSMGILADHGSGMFADDRLGVVPRSKLAQLARGFLYGKQGSKRTIQPVDSGKPRVVADLVAREAAAGRHVLVPVAFDEEGEIIARLLDPAAPFALIDGRTPDAEREAILDRFRAGDVRILIAKPATIGYGFNLQFVRSIVFSGFDDSFERLYQTVRRAYRFGQTETVRVFFPYVPELEGLQFTNVKQKEARFMAEVEQQERYYRAAIEGLAA